MNTAWLLEAALRTLIMGSITLLALQVLRIEQVRARRTAWLLALGGALLMPLLVAAHIGPRILPDFPRPQTAEFSVESGLASGTLVYPVMPTTDAAMPSVIAVVDADATRPLKMSAAGIALSLYIVITSLLLLRLGLGLAMALRLKWRAQRIDARRINMPAAATADVRVSAQLANPVTVTSSILLPRNYLQWDAATLRIVLSHEFAHVRQKDFYVQLLAGLHCAVFWFNPFSWWLQRQLADLGEALSDHAASEQAESRASYAEVLLSFATGSQLPSAAVAMARSSNLAPRIERLLSDRGFERSFLGKPRLPWVAAAVVIMALVASTAVKRVDAAEPSIVTPPTQEAPQSPEAVPTPETPPPADAPPAPTKPAPARPPARPIPPLIARAPVVPAVPPVPAVAPLPAVAPVTAVAPVLAAARTPAVPPVPATPPWRVAANAVSPNSRESSEDHALSTWVDIDDGGVSYMNIDKDEVFVFKSGDSRAMFNGDFKKRFGRDMPTAEGDFIFYQHQGKPYLIQVPAILAKAQELFAPLKYSHLQEANLGRARAYVVTQRKMLRERPMESKLSTAEFQSAVEEISKMLEQMKNEKLTVQADQKILDALQNRLGSIQGRLGELQGQIAMQTTGVMQEELAAEQEELAAEQAQREAEHERMGGTNQKIINDAQRELKPLIEQAIKDGRVKPVN